MRARPAGAAPRNKRGAAESDPRRSSRRSRGRRQGGALPHARPAPPDPARGLAVPAHRREAGQVELLRSSTPCGPRPTVLAAPPCRPSGSPARTRTSSSSAPGRRALGSPQRQLRTLVGGWAISGRCASLTEMRHAHAEGRGRSHADGERPRLFARDAGRPRHTPKDAGVDMRRPRGGRNASRTKHACLGRAPRAARRRTRACATGAAGDGGRCTSWTRGGLRRAPKDAAWRTAEAGGPRSPSWARCRWPTPRTTLRVRTTLRLGRDAEDADASGHGRERTRTRADTDASGHGRERTRREWMAGKARAAYAVVEGAAYAALVGRRRPWPEARWDVRCCDGGGGFGLGPVSKWPRPRARTRDQRGAATPEASGTALIAKRCRVRPGTVTERAARRAQWAVTA
ncbi:hypothetical protein FHU30_003148 [Actinomadura rupiterrae]|nr:hypothetical protein [Actinomadura rupiterrae]